MHTGVSWAPAGQITACSSRQCPPTKGANPSKAWSGRADMGTSRQGPFPNFAFHDRVLPSHLCHLSGPHHQSIWTPHSHYRIYPPNPACGAGQGCYPQGAERDPKSHHQAMLPLALFYPTVYYLPDCIASWLQPLPQFPHPGWRFQPYG